MKLALFLDPNIFLFGKINDNNLRLTQFQTEVVIIYIYIVNARVFLSDNQTDNEFFGISKILEKQLLTTPALKNGTVYVERVVLRKSGQTAKSNLGLLKCPNNDDDYKRKKLVA